MWYKPYAFAMDDHNLRSNKTCLEMSLILRTPEFCIMWENKAADQLCDTVTAKLISAFVFAIWIIQSLYFLNPKFWASCHLLWLHSLDCVGPGWKPRRPVFSERGLNHNTIKLTIRNAQNGPVPPHNHAAYYLSIWDLAYTNTPALYLGGLLKRLMTGCVGRLLNILPIHIKAKRKKHTYLYNNFITKYPIGIYIWWCSTSSFLRNVYLSVYKIFLEYVVMLMTLILVINV